MFQYVIRRLLYAVPTMIVVVTLIFFVMRVMPGDPAAEILGEYATEQSLHDLREQLGLNKPLYQQYLTFLGDLVRGNFGTSIFTGESVAGMIADVFPFTLELTITGIIVGSLIGIPVGVYSALHRNTLLDHLGRIFALSGLSMPIFFMGLLLLLVFAVKLQWFGVISGISSDTWGAHIDNLVLPSLTIGLVQAAFLMRITRSSMLEVISQDYIRTARSKGLPERIVDYRHALKNALLPVVTVLGLYVGTIIGGAVLTETVFTRPGLGKVLADAVLSRDYPLVQVALIIFSFLVVLVNLITDLTYAVLDPRIKVQ